MEWNGGPCACSPLTQGAADQTVQFLQVASMLNGMEPYGQHDKVGISPPSPPNPPRPVRSHIPSENGWQQAFFQFLFVFRRNPHSHNLCETKTNHQAAL